MIAPRVLSLVAAFVFTAQANLLAQQEPPVAPGDRVRVTAPTEVSSRLVGTVVEMGADTCVLEVQGRAEPMALPFVSVTSLEVSRGKKGHAGTGALVGFGLGAVFGGILGGTFCIEQCDNMGGRAVAGAALFGLAGALVGATAGSFIRTERWEVVELQSVRVSLTPHGRHGLAIYVSIRF